MPQSGLSKAMILTVATAASFMMFLDTTVVNVALEGIRQSLKADLAGLQWVVDGYALTFASLLLSAGSISDRTGAKKAFLLGLAVFTVTSFLCGAATNLTVLIAARAVQGIGGALIVPSSLALISRAYPGHLERAKALSLWGALGGGVAISAGPVIGGLLTGSLGWRSVFFINVPVGLLAFWMATRIADDAAVAKARKTDWAGQVAAVVALTAVTFLFIEGPNLGWTSPWSLLSLAGTVASVLGFLAAESRVAEPMLPLPLFQNREFTLSSLIGFAINFAFYGQLFFMNVYLQQNVGLSASITGWRFVPETVAAPIFTTFMGRMTGRISPRRALLLGTALCGIGLAGLAGAGLRGSVVTDSFWMILIGIGAGSPAFLVAVMLSSVSTERAGLAAGALSAARQVGGLLGVALLGGVVGHSVSDAGARLALGVSAAVMAAAAAAAVTIRAQETQSVDFGEAVAEAMA